MTECGECRKERLKGAFCRVISVVALIVALAVALVAAEFPMVLSVAEGASMSYICIEADSGKVLDESNADARKFPASTTKILTALVVLENMPLDLEFRVDDSAVGVEGSSIYLKRGEIVTVGDMLYGLMLRSGNDAAVALAVATAGSVERFAAMMNERAAACGAERSHFVNPHGLHDEEHYTTARDLALITAEAYRNADLRRIFSTRSVTVGEGESRRYFANKNKLLGTFEGANGVKTGYTTKSGRCLVGGTYRDGMQLISVVLDRYDMWAETKRILDSAFAGFGMTDVLTLPEWREGMERVEVRLDERGAPSPAEYPAKRSGDNAGIVFLKD